jgi:hypothetical protein
MDKATQEALAGIMVWCVSAISGKPYHPSKKAVYREIEKAFREDSTVTADKVIGIMNNARWSLK